MYIVESLRRGNNHIYSNSQVFLCAYIKLRSGPLPLPRLQQKADVCAALADVANRGNSPYSITLLDTRTDLQERKEWTDLWNNFANTMTEQDQRRKKLIIFGCLPSSLGFFCTHEIWFIRICS